MNFKWKSAGAMVLGLVLLAPAGFAQDRRDRDHDGDRDDRGYNEAGRGNDNSQVASQRGYQDGLRTGQNDRSRNANRNYRNDEWKRGDSGYNRNMGARGQYKQAYRDGYARGYEDAYANGNGNGNWGRNGRTPRNGYPNSGYPNSGYPNNGYPNSGYPNNGYPNNQGGYLTQAAQQNGNTDGIYYGQMDRQNGHSNRPTEVKGYKDADHGYTSSLGSKSDFQRIYRDAFIRGYQQGFGNGGYRR